jgi:hypothetical protein
MKTKNQSNVERRAEFASELIEKLSALVSKKDVVVEQIKPKEEPKRVEKTSFESKPQLKASPFFNISEEMIDKYREPDADFEYPVQRKPKPKYYAQYEPRYSTRYESEYESEYEPEYKSYDKYKTDTDTDCGMCGVLSLFSKRNRFKTKG